MLISPIIPMMSMYKLPHGQYGYNGHVVNLPQNIATFIDSLPRHPTDLDIIVVRQQQSTQSHHDFRVRRSKILNALHWLISNNIYFRNITINNDNLASLPQDDNITGIHTVLKNQLILKPLKLKSHIQLIFQGLLFHMSLNTEQNNSTYNNLLNSQYLVMHPQLFGQLGVIPPSMNLTLKDILRVLFQLFFQQGLVTFQHHASTLLLLEITSNTFYYTRTEDLPSTTDLGTLLLIQR